VFAAAVAPPAGRGAVLVAYESGVDAYAEALQGIKAGLGADAVRAVDVRGPADLARALAAPDVRLVIAIGSGALKAVHSRAIPAPMISVLTLRSGEADGAAARVDFEIPLATQLAAIRALWPSRLRAGIIRNPARSRLAVEAIEARVRKEGYAAVVVDSDGPGQLLRAVGSLKGKVDFLLCLPDPDLFNSVTVKPLVLAAIEARLPVVGFSPSFVRAGAAAGIYPDYRDTGAQAADLALRLLRGDDHGATEGPRKVRVAVNQRIAHLLGIEFRAGPGVEVLK
jgi:ABC-type uncharacterized transport system substrate-binding protein